MPRKINKRGVVAYGRFDIRHLAAIARYYDQRGIRIQSKSDLLYKIAEDYHALLSIHGGLEKVEGTSDSLAILQRLGLDWSDEGYAQRSVVNELKIESLQQDFGDGAEKAMNTITLSDLEKEARALAAQYGGEDEDE